VRESLAAREGGSIDGLAPLEQLNAIFAAAPAFRFQAPALTVFTDSRWFSTRPLPGEGAPLLELRRWPGDSIITFYAIAGPAGEGSPPIPGGVLERVESVEGSHTAWQGSLETGAGERPADWFEIVVPDSPAHLAALLLPGDAGMGAGAVESLALELRAVLGRAEVDAESWRRHAGLPGGKTVVLPETGGTPGDKSELDAPWQVAQASGFTMGLPPGFRTRRTDGGVPAPVAIEGSELWFRGRFEDSAGDRVIVGDGRRAGYVARIDPPTERWAAGKRAPLAAPQATPVRSEPYPLAAERCGALSVTAERWKENGFSGDWLVFRLVFGNAGYEIGLPVLAGRRSPSLYWLPMTWRAAGEAPAPPPVDPAERFGIRFEQLTPAERGELPWMEGYLRVPGLRAEVPKDWYPAASLRSRDGYPIRFVDRGGETRGTLSRVESEDLSVVGQSFSVSESKRKQGAKAVRERADGARLFVSREGHGFLFEPAEFGGTDAREAWLLLLDSVQVSKSGRRRDKNRN
jgi:hypothetical protein